MMRMPPYALLALACGLAGNAGAQGRVATTVNPGSTVGGSGVAGAQTGVGIQSGGMNHGVTINPTLTGSSPS